MTSNAATVERIQTYHGIFEKSLRFAVVDCPAERPMRSHDGIEGIDNGRRTQ
jgi:hypothetical protein